ncbi:MaoC family dehydratase N-terminal domain-containing protein [Spongiibacter taiwanensis]|uniref:MaoC/PaaZ C-terminal domain-containing protein n=1 Tax=Spongiibacter taiwanensis TaxID=1748242 RepID=UPI002034B57C|nr:MaoC/PaaZ C-terminal domain-containing protein [Spongiibacter taiwanensis]USA42533.1 MaoC family dehydratase N-terminal domain-containing protein [Spongiibacter taiwanensis]
MNLDALRDHVFQPIIVNYTDKDTMLYALSLGAGSDPMDERELPFVFEKNLKSLPSIAAVLAHPGLWLADKKFEINLVKLLHGEQRCTFHKPLPASGELRGEYRVDAVMDKGADKGALMYFAKDLYDNASGELLCSVLSTYFLRGDGGCGSFGEVPEAMAKVPETPADFSEEIVIDKRAALFYRLNGDRNPIHADPELAKKAGFPAPILQGLCAYGICGLSVVRQALDYDPSKMGSLNLRFSSPVFPGETLKVEAWKVDGGIAFQAFVKEREKLAISDGFVAVH